jgi:hypothetical protein
MPNHCYQGVHIHGPRFLVKELYDHLTKADPEFCQVVKPMPFEQWLAPRTQWQGFDVAGWYDWRVENWGTKWDVAEVEITQPLTIHDDEDTDPSNMSASFSFNCWTAWGPPIPVWDKLHSMGISVDADYQDEGGLFEGEYLNGVDESWKPELEEEDA